MGIHRLKHTFTSGELSPYMTGRVDFERHRDGCWDLVNATVMTQGPAVRRSGFKFIYDLTSLNTVAPFFRMVEFVFDELQAYALIFCKIGNEANVFHMLVATGDGLVTSGGDPIMLTIPNVWNETTFWTFDYAQSGDDLYIAQANSSIKIIRRLSHTSWELIEPVITSAPAKWNSTDGYPQRITFHQQRLFAGANLTGKQNLWASKSGSFLDFGTSSPLLASDGMAFTLDSGTQNKIVWLVSGKALNIGTVGNEWTLTGGGQAAITPTAVLAQRQSNSGSEAIKPLLIGLTTLFVEREGKTVNEFAYDYAFDSYKAADISILAPHLTLEHSIIDWAYQQVPDNTVWCVRADGILLGLTYQREHKVIGWHRHYTEGNFKAICAIPDRTTREDNVWVVIERDINGPKYYLERLASRFTGKEAIDGRFLDSYIVGTSDTPSATFSGLTHLIGTNVGVLADGAVHPDLTVSTTGTITLDRPCKHVVVGLKYSTIITPVLMDLQTPEGTVLGRQQRITNLDIGLYNSLGLELYKVTEDGESHTEDKPFRLPRHLVGQPVPLFTGVYHLDFPEGFDRRSYYSLRQHQPLPLNVLYVVDTVEVYE